VDPESIASTTLCVDRSITATTALFSQVM